MIDVTDGGIGAAGDGVTDDTAAIQAALSQPGDVYFPADGGPRTYLYAGTPGRLRERTRLVIPPGATIRRAGGPGLFRNRWPDDAFGGYSGRGHITIEGGGTLDMAGDAASGSTLNPASALGVVHAESVTVRDITILNVPGAHGIDLLGCRNVRIENVTFAGYLADPDDAQARESIQIDGAYAAPSGDAAPFDQTACSDVIITRCRFGPSAELPAPQRAVGSHGYMDVVQGHEHTNIRVINNTMDGVTDAGVVAWCWEQSVIADNTILNPGANGIVARDRGWHLDVVHNRVYDAGTSGIYVTGTALNNTVLHGNTVVGSSRDAHNTHYGICVQGGAKSINIASNRVRVRGSGSNAKYGLYVSGSCSGILRDGNDLRSSGITGSRKDDSVSPVVLSPDAL